MRSRGRTGKPPWRSPQATALLFAALFATSVHGRTAALSVDRVDAGAAQVRDLQVRLEWPADAVRGTVQLRAAEFSLDAGGYDYRDLRWTCELTATAEGAYRCEGPLAAASGPVLADAQERRLAVTLEEGSMGAELAGSGGRLRLDAGSPGSDELALVLRQIPVVWLQALVDTAWTAGRLRDGRLDGELHLRPDRGTTRGRGSFQLAGLALESPDGRVAAEGVEAGIELDLHLGGSDDSADLDLTFLGGELLFDPFYIALPQTPVGMRLQAVSGADGWTLPVLEWSDGEVLQARGSAAMEPGGALRTLSLTARSGDPGRLAQRYLSGVLAPAGLGELRLSGAVEGGVEMRDGALTSASLSLDNVNAIDGAGRFSFAGLHGQPRWTSAGPVESDLSWTAAAIYGLGIGAATLPLESNRRRIGLQAPVEVALLGGRLRLEHVEIEPGTRTQPGRIALGMGLEGLDLGDLSQRLGWPPFTGTIAGSIPSAIYQGDTLTLDGGLEMRLFDGRLGIRALSMERPFGVAPTLSADVDFEGIELQPLTAAFGFGEIVGQLAGHVHQLRLVDWSPVRFDAYLHSDPAYRGRRRISQRAVRDIGSVGGNFLVTGLQNRALELFSSFGYREIGIRCRLIEQVCHMDGIRSQDDGYIIVEGAGLPRLTVAGFNRRVDWPVLVERLRLAASGQTLIID